MVRSSFLNAGITFAILKVSGKLSDGNDKFAISDIDLLRAVWNNFKNLLEILAGADLLMLNFFITHNTSSLFLGDIKKELAFGFARYL